MILELRLSGLPSFLSLWALGPPSLPARKECFNSKETPSQQEGFLSGLWSHQQVGSMTSLSLWSLADVSILAQTEPSAEDMGPFSAAGQCAHD